MHRLLRVTSGGDSLIFKGIWLGPGLEASIHFLIHRTLLSRTAACLAQPELIDLENSRFITLLYRI